MLSMSKIQSKLQLSSFSKPLLAFQVGVFFFSKQNQFIDGLIKPIINGMQIPTTARPLYCCTAKNSCLIRFYKNINGLTPPQRLAHQRCSKCMHA